MTHDLNNIPPKAHTDHANFTSHSNSMGPVGFEVGISANTSAILEFLRKLVAMHNMGNMISNTMVKEKTNLSVDYSETQVKAGDLAESEADVSGATQLLGGVLSLGAGAAGSVGNSGVDGLSEASCNGLGKNLDEMDDATVELIPDDDAATTSTLDSTSAATDPAATSTASTAPTGTQSDDNTHFDKIKEEIKSGEYKIAGKGEQADFQSNDKELLKRLTPTQRKELGNVIKQRISDVNNTLKENQLKARQRFDAAQMVSNSVSGLASGSGQIAGGVYKGRQADQQAAGTQYQAAQEQMESLVHSTDQQSDQDLQTAESLSQLIPELARANNAILNA